MNNGPQKGEDGNRKTSQEAAAVVQVRKKEGLICSSSGGGGEVGGIQEHSAELTELDDELNAAYGEEESSKMVLGFGLSN